MGVNTQKKAVAMGTIVNAFRRVWLVAGVAFALTVTVAWMGLLGIRTFEADTTIGAWFHWGSPGTLSLLRCFCCDVFDWQVA